MNKPKLNQPDVETTTTIGAWATSTSASTSASTKRSIPITSSPKPTLEEVKKEWEALGWFFIGLPEDVKNKVSCITISKYVGKNIFSTTDIQLDLEEKDCFIRGLINYRELQLLTKTFRALGWEV